MAEFSIHHNVNEMVKILGMEDDEDIEAQAERFQKSCQKISKSSSDVFLHKLENSRTPAFKAQYEQLKSRNVLELDPLVQLLARITDDPKLKNFLRVHQILRKPSTTLATVQCKKPSNGTRDSSYQVPGPQQRQYQSQHSLTSSQSMSNFPTPLRDRNLPHSPSVESVRVVKDVTTDMSRVSNVTTSSKSKTVVKKRGRAFEKRYWNFLSFDYKVVDKVPAPLLSQMSLFEQENALVQDLLHVLVGIEGMYIRLHPHEAHDSKKNVLLVDDGADKLLKTLAEKIIAICPLYSSVIHFVDENDSGLVNQALAASMRSVLKDYFNMIAQLDSHYRRGSLTMQTMWYYLQCWMANLDILRHYSSSINTAKVSGGAVLSILHNKTMGFKANSKLLEFCFIVTRDACVPYFQILDKWITEGRIDDPFREFFIEEITVQKSGEVTGEEDSLWESRFKVNANKIPVFLSSFEDKIFKTGKYLSVIRDYGKEIESLPPEDPLSYSVEEKDYSSRIETAYQSASRQLLGLLLHDANLVGHLESVKHYFFMDQGDFVVQFMDSAEDELQKDVDDTNPTRLASLLELAIKTSILKIDPHHDHVTVGLMSDSLFKQLSSIISKGRKDENEFQDSTTLKGFEAIVLEYNVQWPLNLILSERNLTCYQILFRHLFLCNYVERQLLSVWTDNRTARRYALKAVTGYSEAFALRQKMLLFLHNRTFFMMVAVVEPHYRSFMSRIVTFSQVDELTQEHCNFVDSCLRDCMLSQEFALQYLIKLLHLCMSFADFMLECHKLSMPYELQQFNPNPSPVKERRTGVTGEALTFEQQVRHYHDEFNYTLTGFLHEIATQEQDHFSGNVLHIIYRLDFNEYYARMREEGEEGSYANHQQYCDNWTDL